MEGAFMIESKCQGNNKLFSTFADQAYKNRACSYNPSIQISGI